MVTRWGHRTFEKRTQPGIKLMFVIKALRSPVSSSAHIVIDSAHFSFRYSGFLTVLVPTHHFLTTTISNISVIQSQVSLHCITLFLADRRHTERKVYTFKWSSDVQYSVLLLESTHHLLWSFDGNSLFLTPE